MARFSYREQYAKYSRYFQTVRQEYEQKPEVRESVELLLTLFTISFFIVFALRPTVNTISELFANINSQKEIKEKLETKLANLSRARQNYTSEEKRLFLIEQALPRDPAPDFFLRQIEGLSAAHGLALRTFNVGEALLYGQPPDDLKENSSKKPSVAGTKQIIVTYELAGNFENSMAFLEDLENLRQIFSVQTFSFGANQKSQDNNITLTIVGAVNNYPSNKQ